MTPPTFLAATSVLERAVRSPGDELAHLLEDIAGDPLLAILLAGLRHDRTALTEVAARSYWHCNGFAKVVLGAHDDPDGPKVRLHVWPEAQDDTPRGETDPHGHRWDFASTVLVGEGLDVVRWEIVPDDGELFGVTPTTPAVVNRSSAGSRSVCGRALRSCGRTATSIGAARRSCTRSSPSGAA